MTTAKLDYFRSCVNSWTLWRAVLLLRVLGGYDQDEIYVNHGRDEDGDLVELFSLREIAGMYPRTCLVAEATFRFEFIGGPDFRTRYRGTVQTFIADRLLRVYKTRGMSGIVEAFTTCNDIPEFLVEKV